MWAISSLIPRSRPDFYGRPGEEGLDRKDGRKDYLCMIFDLSVSDVFVCWFENHPILDDLRWLFPI